MVELALSLLILGLLGYCRFRALVGVLTGRLLLWGMRCVRVNVPVGLQTPLESRVEPLLDVVVSPAV